MDFATLFAAFGAARARKMAASIAGIERLETSCWK
jgi:hypothetical protein